jgi:hypothetical protein
MINTLPKVQVRGVCSAYLGSANQSVVQAPGASAVANHGIPDFPELQSHFIDALPTQLSTTEKSGFLCAMITPTRGHQSRAHIKCGA